MRGHMMADYPRIGRKVEGETDEVYELIISDFVTPLIPPAGSKLDAVTPADYFITSGDAIQKTDQLYRDIAGFGRRLQQAIQEESDPKLRELDNQCTKELQGALNMRKALETSRGSSVFMETEWEQGKLLCIPKNPRLRK